MTPKRRPFVYNAKTLLTIKGMVLAYLKWSFQKRFSKPTVKTKYGVIASFNVFSEYWGTLTGLPSLGEYRLLQELIHPPALRST